MTSRSKEKSDVSRSIEENQQKYWDPLIDGVKWVEKYSDSLDNFFNKLPDFISTFVATLGIFTLGSTLRGEWVLILVSTLKHISGHTKTNTNLTAQEVFGLFNGVNLKMENFGTIFIASHSISFSMYFLIGGFLHWYFYINRRHQAKEWKIQPEKWLTPQSEMKEVYYGVISLFIVGSVTATLATYIINGNPSTIYYQFDEYGWLWFLLQYPVIYIYLDYTTYILHRLYHTRFLYKNFHKLHHQWKAPTAFSVTAVHPVELVHIQLTMFVPLFAFPVHYLPFFTVVMYNYYHGITSHSGIDFKAHWWQPWQPDADFHDKHHEFFHCNFGFNMWWWDKLHNTMRVTNKLYTEETYNGEAVDIDSEEAKRLAEIDPDAKENLVATKAYLNAENTKTS